MLIFHLGYFWHITDVHVDPDYWINDEVNSCNEVIHNRGIYGDYECDSPYKLLKSAVKAMVDNGREPEFIVYSGLVIWIQFIMRGAHVDVHT